jgi:SAM-dependent methyltransferase
MGGRDIWNRYAAYFNAEEFQVFPPDHREIQFYKALRTEFSGECLEIGAGSGRLARALFNRGCTTALEPSDAMIAAWSPGDSALALRVQGTGEFLPFPDDTFEFVCFPYNGLQCVLDTASRRMIVEEAFRVAAPGGAFVLEVSPVFSRRPEEPLSERYRTVLHDGRELSLMEKVERCSSTGNIRYHMFYTVKGDGGAATEDMILELASISADETIGMVGSAGFSAVSHFGDYDLSAFDEECSPRLLVKAVKGV